MKRVGDPDWTPFEDMTPDGTIPMQGLRILVYADTDGTVNYHSVLESENAMHGLIIGFMAEVQHDLLHDLGSDDDDA